MDPADPCIFEILRRLPLDVVEDQVWKLLDSNSAKNFRLTSASAKQLSEVLITSANFLFEASPAINEDGSSMDVAASDAADLSSVTVASRVDLQPSAPTCPQDHRLPLC